MSGQQRITSAPLPRRAPCKLLSMKGDPRVIDYLNRALRSELTAVSQYWVHFRLAEDWGFSKLAKKERQESIEEMRHADRLIARIVFLEVIRTCRYSIRCASARTSSRSRRPILRRSMMRGRSIPKRAAIAAMSRTTYRWSYSRTCWRTKKVISTSSKPNSGLSTLSAKRTSDSSMPIQPIRWKIIPTNPRSLRSPAPHQAPAG